jgi:hypothetical protein
MWSATDITIILDDSLTDDPFVTADILTPLGRVRVMAEVTIEGRVMVAAGLHAHGVTLGRGGLGAHRIRWLMQAIMEALDCDACIIEGAARTSVAAPGRRPDRLRFTRAPASPPPPGRLH